MLSKEKLVKLLSGMYYNATGNLASLEFLESKSWADLQAIYDSEVQRTLANNTPEARAARQTTLELENEKVRFEAEKMQREYLAQQNPPADPKVNREIFSSVCRQCGISENDANFSILVQAMHGDLFDTFAAGQTIAKMRGSLAPATPAEQQKWAAEAAEAERQAAQVRQDFLRNRATPAQLREAAFNERNETRGPAQIRLEEEICLSRKLDLARGVNPVLPATWNNEPLTSEFIKRASILTLKNLVSRFGQSYVTARLYGIKVATANVLGDEMRYEFD